MKSERHLDANHLSKSMQFIGRQSACPQRNLQLPFYMYSQDQSTCCLCGGCVDSMSFRFECFTLNKQHEYYSFSGAAAHSKCLTAYPRVVDFLAFYLAVVLDVFLQPCWALVPIGDKFVDCFDSTLCEEKPPEYESSRIIDVLSGVGNIRLNTIGDECRLLWESGVEAVEYIMSPTGVWRGAEVVVQCKPESFLIHWRHLYQHFGQIYLHNQDCAIFAPDHFEAIYT